MVSLNKSIRFNEEKLNAYQRREDEYVLDVSHCYFASYLVYQLHTIPYIRPTYLMFTASCFFEQIGKSLTLSRVFLLFEVNKHLCCCFLRQREEIIEN